MTPPIQNPTQENIYRKYIKRLQELTIQAHTDLRDIKIKHTKDISPTEIENFETFQYNIEYKISTACSRLRALKVSNIRPPVGANEEFTAIVEAKQNTLAQSPEPAQVKKGRQDYIRRRPM